MMVGANRGDVEGLVLWDPVVSGSAYIEELTALHWELQRLSYWKSERGKNGENHTEILGFPLTNSLSTDLEEINLLAIKQRPANNILVIESNDKVGEGQLREHLKRIGAQLEYQHLPSPRIHIQDPYKAHVPNQILQSVVSWSTKVLP